MKNNSVKGITKDLLIAMGLGLLITATVVAPGVGYVASKIGKDKFEKARKQGYLNATIKRLERQQLVSWREQDGVVALTLTEKGRKRVLLYNAENLSLQTKNTNDGFTRVVIFDIPEKQKVAREILRKKLKEAHFAQLQKSVFVTTAECKDAIDALRHMLGIAPYVNYILAKEVSNVTVESAKRI